MRQWERKGTISITKGKVTGVGTQFSVDVRPGDAVLALDGSLQVVGEVVSIESDTAMTLTSMTNVSGSFKRWGVWPLGAYGNLYDAIRLLQDFSQDFMTVKDQRSQKARKGAIPVAGDDGKIDRAFLPFCTNTGDLTSELASGQQLQATEAKLETRIAELERVKNRLTPEHTNEVMLADGFGGGDLHLAYRGSSQAITQFIFNDGLGSGGLSNIFAGVVFADANIQTIYKESGLGKIITFPAGGQWRYVVYTPSSCKFYTNTVAGGTRLFENIADTVTGFCWQVRP